MWSLEHATSINQLNNKGHGMDSTNLKFVWYKELIIN